MSAKSVSPLNNPSLESERSSDYHYCPYCSFFTKFSGSLNRHLNKFHEEAIAREGERVRGRGGKLNRFGTRDYGLPYWECLKCHYRIGSALLSGHYRPCQKWQDIEGTGKKCDGILVRV